ncbi:MULTISPECIES: endolytic transglycosylase MltG [Mesobacillus]|uniref:Endolytic transglycosylase MltG n=1 Tax=Mesobacillus selenatarsenatis TaxID=388741 RepID=A0A846TI27_9BACI|nr:MULTISPECIES: endolytic transglycosylase MltG [Mesobacillus]NKE05102.1 endolytic transglycosylase MltG [Mesobacillus selenatarsenatis]
MNKRTAQAFALGLIFAAIFLWAGSSVIAKKEPEKEVGVTDAKKILEEKGYKVLSSGEYAELNEKKAEVIKEEKPKEEAPAEKKEEVKEEKKFTLIIAGGMSPGDVATMLASQGIIDDETKFERFLIDQGYHTKVQIGKYELTSGLDYHQIAKIITKNR